MDYLWVFVAFGFGFLAKQLGLPPLVGYLAAGFGLHLLGVEPAPSLETLGELGVTLLLFTIGLKLNIKNLFKSEVWASTLGHMGMITGLTIINSLFLGLLGFNHFMGIDLTGAAVIGFAVSFSSTVIAVKVLEDNGEMRARHGQVAIGILIVQDIAAVFFVSLASDLNPSWWALCLLALPLARPLLHHLLERCGHGELLPLAGIFLAFSGGQLFELVGLKAHLGALIFAVLLSTHKKSAELAKSLLGFKDIFLIAFFLSIGFTALPTIDMLGVALIMAIALPVKAALFFFWLSGLRLRRRSAFLASLSLANYSEFGLIVCSISVSQGLLDKEWLVIMALSMSLSFVFSSILNTRSHYLYGRLSNMLKRFESPRILPEDQFSQPKNATALVIGMGRVGTGAYDALQDDLQQKVCGVDVDRQRVADHVQVGRYVIFGDAEAPEFWSHIDLSRVGLIMFSMPNPKDTLQAQIQLNRIGYQGKTASIVRYEDEREELLAGGIDEVFNFYAKAGSGFAEQSFHLMRARDAT